MPPKPHSFWTSHTCGVCLRKEKNLRKITDPILQLIHTLVLPEYSTSVQPSVICLSCQKTLTEISKEGASSHRKLPNVDYSSLVWHSIVTRSTGQCQCTICRIGRMSGPAYKTYLQSLDRKPGRPATVLEAPSPAIKRCDKCYGEIHPGIPHPCNKRSRQSNVEDVVSNMSPLSRQRLASTMLDEFTKEQGVSRRDGELHLKTKGPNMKTVCLGPRKKVPVLSHDTMVKTANNLCLSGKSIKELAKMIRKIYGRSSIEANFEVYLTDLNSCLSDFFAIDKIEIKTSEDEVVEKTGVFCTDIIGLIVTLIEARGLDPEHTEVILGADDGQGSLKICMTVKTDDPNHTPKEKGAGDFAAGTEAKLSSVKRLMLLAIVPGVSESYSTMEKIFSKLPSLSGLDYSLTVDMKMALFLLGKMSAASTHPCLYCSAKAPFLIVDAGELFTIDDLKELNDMFMASGLPRDKAKQFGNCANKPILAVVGNKLVILLLNIPSLHILIGLVGKFHNHIAKLEGPVSKKFAEKFLTVAQITTTKKRGGAEDTQRQLKEGIASFEGNQSRKYLKRIDKMEELLEQDNTLSDYTKAQINLCITALKTFNKVVISCFGQTLDSTHGDYRDLIKDFSRQYRAIDNLSVTVKMHCLEVHVEQFLDMKGDGVKGLGFWSEQSYEAVHYHWKTEASRTTLQPGHPNYDENQLAIFLRFCGKNI